MREGYTIVQVQCVRDVLDFVICIVKIKEIEQSGAILNKYKSTLRSS